MLFYSLYLILIFRSIFLWRVVATPVIHVYTQICFDLFTIKFKVYQNKCKSGVPSVAQRFKRDTSTNHTDMTTSAANDTLHTELIEISKISFRVEMANTRLDYVNATNTPAQLFARMTVFTTMAFICVLLSIGIYVAHRCGKSPQSKTIWEKYWENICKCTTMSRMDERMDVLSHKITINWNLLNGYC